MSFLYPITCPYSNFHRLAQKLTWARQPVAVHHGCKEIGDPVFWLLPCSHPASPLIRHTLHTRMRIGCEVRLRVSFSHCIASDRQLRS